jgi:hypothetical protein
MYIDVKDVSPYKVKLYSEQDGRFKSTHQMIDIDNKKLKLMSIYGYFIQCNSSVPKSIWISNDLHNKSEKIKRTKYRPVLDLLTKSLVGVYIDDDS